MMFKQLLFAFIILLPAGASFASPGSGGHDDTMGVWSDWSALELQGSTKWYKSTRRAARAAERAGYTADFSSGSCSLDAEPRKHYELKRDESDSGEVVYRANLYYQHCVSKDNEQIPVVGLLH